MGQFRYPGPFPFSTGQEEIFWGRETDTDRLYTKILANPTTVLHAKSGTGKSSLINAGILPAFRRNNPEFIPIVIPFEGIKKDENNTINLKDTGEDALVKETISAITARITPFPDKTIPYLKKQEAHLWYWAKRLQAEEKSLLLIFDQFENIESYSYEQLTAFKKNLAQLLGAKMPPEFYAYFKETSPAFSDNQTITENSQEIEKYNIEAAFIKQQPDARVLFVIKDEKLGVMSSLSDSFPDILKNDYLLQMLDPVGAESAIKVPAAKEGNFASPRIEFDAGVIEFLKENLTENTTGRIDPLEIQIICSYVEKQVISDLREQALIPYTPVDKVTIRVNYFPPIKDIVTFFYFDSWKKVKPAGTSTIEFDKLRSEIIKDLVVEGIKIPVYINNFSKSNRAIVLELANTGLVRKTILDGKDFYQLCHDRFIKPLTEDSSALGAKEDAEKKANKEKNRAGKPH